MPIPESIAERWAQDGCCLQLGGSPCSWRCPAGSICRAAALCCCLSVTNNRLNITFSRLNEKFRRTSVSLIGCTFKPVDGFDATLGELK